MTKFNLGDKVVLSELGLKESNNDRKGVVGEIFGIFKDGFVTVEFPNCFYHRFSEDCFDLHVEELLNGKFVCTYSCGIFLTEGKVYEFINGVSEIDGVFFPQARKPFENLEDLNDYIASKFIPFIE